MKNTKEYSPFPKEYPCYCGSYLLKKDMQYACKNKKCYRHNHPITGAIRSGYKEFDIGVEEKDETSTHKISFMRDENFFPRNVIYTKKPCTTQKPTK